MATEPNRVKALFQAAIDVPALADRRAFIECECAGDAELLARLEALIAAHEQLSAASEVSPSEAPAGGGHSSETVEIDTGQSGQHPGAEVHAPGPEAAPTLVDRVIAGKYKVRQAIGEGGMGSVYLAEQTRPVRRMVALKLIKPGMDSRTVLARFESERQALALMDHPNIAKVLDAGTTDDGRPFFVMELVKGIPLTDYCDQHRLDLATRLALFRQICSAVQHAHQKGIIHRDLKPTNILVESHDGRPVPKVIDFGLAKATSGMQLSEHSLFTAFGSVTGTPLYMAPEQATFNAIDVDTRADIYALGVILYELLTGSTPIQRDTMRRAALDEMLRVIREEEPPTPSTRISASGTLPSLAAARHVEPARLSRLVKGDLDWIVMKALAKERSRRYDSAIGLANDVERFLNDEPVTAGPPTARYRTAKFIRRHRGQVVAASLVILALVGGTIGTTFGLVRARAEAAARQRALIAEAEQRREAQRQAGLARAEATAKEQARQLAERRLAQVTRMNEVLGSIFGDLDVGKAEKEGKPLAAVLGDRLDQAAAALEGEAIGDPLAVARLQATLATSQFNLGYLQRAIGLYERSIATLARLLGPIHPETLAAMSRLGVVYIWVGRNDRAVSLNERALEGLRASLGPDHPETLVGVRRLAHAYRGSGRSDRAIPLLERTFEGARAKWGPDHFETARVAAQLGVAYQWAGRLDRAIPLLEQAVRDFRAKLGPDNLHTLEIMGETAVAYASCGDFDRAVPLHEQAVEGLREKAGLDSLITLVRMSQLAQTYIVGGQLDRGVRLLEQTLPLIRAKLGPEDLTYLYFMYDLIQAYTASGHVDRAAAIDAELVDQARSTLGRMEGNNLDTGTVKALFAGAFLRRKRYEEAAPLLKEAYEGLRQQGDNLPPLSRKRLPETLDRLIQLAEETGKPDEAKAWREEKARVEALPGPVLPARKSPAEGTP